MDNKVNQIKISHFLLLKVKEIVLCIALTSFKIHDQPTALKSKSRKHIPKNSVIL